MHNIRTKKYIPEKMAQDELWSYGIVEYEETDADSSLYLNETYRLEMRISGTGGLALKDGDEMVLIPRQFLPAIVELSCKIKEMGLID